MSGSTRIGVGVSDDLVVVRHHGSVSGSTSSLRAVSDDLVVVRHHGSVDRDDMSGRVCVSERRQCESRLGDSTTPWKCSQG